MMSSVQEHYDRFLAGQYTWMAGGHEQQVPRNRDTLAGLGLPGAPGGKALDLGCGSGFQSLALAALGFDVVAVDTSRHLLDELDAAAAAQPITAIRADMLEPDAYSALGPYDVAVCMGDSLTHLESMEEVARLVDDVYANLRPGGMLVLSFRDLTRELTGIDRAIPVRLDEDRLMATFLEYDGDHANVHDMLFNRHGGEWHMEKSAYRKLRISGDEVSNALATHGYTDIRSAVDGGMTTITARKGAP